MSGLSDLGMDVVCLLGSHGVSWEEAGLALDNMRIIFSPLSPSLWGDVIADSLGLGPESTCPPSIPEGAVWNAMVVDTMKRDAHL